ncbi:hypothetical protein [Streptomyces ipomoeae]|uniref:DUF8017 domain-containing protein n=1 Tax=Streptomyces ipomoeae 91-03 TaxID=698759 RepID=L1KY48_9ACTN|nr:hypothetical protein [Streptomyces ipomoeae]EKX65552.1 hypothetical protein STRIP9103_01293 [Streptomyces ipomoeae 91-03]MDX2695355.1 hypothetical protein [Streptomyces ipomoeae]MDX2842344.1 hypothetical protein [Streptomyces ipomoeae]
MWPGQQQPPGGEPHPQQNPYQQPGFQQPNPYQQPGYQQTPAPAPQIPYGQPQWGAPAPVGAPEPPGGGGGNRTKLIAIVAATTVVVTAGVTGFLVLGGDKDEQADGGNGKGSTPSASASKEPSPSASTEESRSADGPEPTIEGWKVVINPKWGTAFDVPADWEVDTPSTIIGFEDSKGKAGDPPLITMSAPAYYKSKWCTSDDDKDGRENHTELAATGTKGASGAKSTEEVAVNQVPWYVYGGYTQPDRKSIVFDEKAEHYTTASGVKGSVAWARSKNTPQKGKCDSDGKAVTFGFKNSAGDFVAWSLYGATGVDEEVPDETIEKILSTVRLYGDPTGG